MAIDLKAVFRVQDNGTAKLRKIMQQTQKVAKATEKMSNANKQAAKAVNTFRDSQGRLRNAQGQFISDSNKVIGSNSKLVSSFSGVTAGLMGLVGAYGAAQGAADLFNATIGAAAKYEQSKVSIEAIFNDKQASDAYLNMVDRMAIDSPLLNSGDMMASSKGMISMLKDVGELEKAWSVIERLMVLEPTQGTSGGAFALLEMWSGDAISMTERFRLPKQELNSIKKLDIPSQIAELDKLLNGMGVTNEAVNKMGSTTLGYWTQIKERAERFLRLVGAQGNTKLGAALGEIIKVFDKAETDGIAQKLSDTLGGLVQKVIDISKWLWEWKEPLAYIVGAVGAALTVFTLVGALSLLANPVALISAGVAALAVGFKALYDVVKSGGSSDLLDSIFGDGTAEKVAAIIDMIKQKFSEMKSGFEIAKNALMQGWATLSDIFSSAWSIIQPILSALWSLLQVVGGVAVIVFNNIIAPALQFITQLFTTLWAIAKPILTLMGAMLQLTGSIVLWLWNTVLAPFVNFITTGLKNAFDGFTDALSIVAGWFQKIGDWANTAKGYISSFADKISSIKIPDWVTNGISTVVSTVGKVLGSESSKSHYHGLANVPYDGYNARLHKGERVLTAQENKEYSQGGGFSGVTITGNQFIVREDADIEKIAYKLAKYIEREALQVG